MTKKIKYAEAIIVVIALVMAMLPLDKTAFAAEDYTILASFSYADGVTRSLIPVGERIYLGEMFVTSSVDEIGFDRYGTLWFIRVKPGVIGWCVENPMEDKYSIEGGVNDEEGNNYIATELVYDTTKKFVIGFKTPDGEVHPTLDLEEQNEILEFYDEEPTYDLSVYTQNPNVQPTIPTPTVTTSEPTEPQVTQTPLPAMSTPTPRVTATPTPEVTDIPTQEKATLELGTSVSDDTEIVIIPDTSTPKVKREAGWYIMYTDSKVLNRYKLKKSVLLAGLQKTKKVKKVKSAGFIEKSGRVIFLTKAGGIGTIDKKGKKKMLLKKGAKKLVKSGKFVVKVKKKNGKYLSVKNK